MLTSSLFYGWLLPTIYLLAFALALMWRRQIWPVAQSAALIAIGCCVAAWLGLVAPTPQADIVGLVVASLVSVLGWVIVQFSRRYLDGEPGQQRYVAALLLTLAAVGVVVLSRNLGVLVVAWTMTSVGLHHLLTFYRDRAPAQIAAHKKFLASRMAEVCLAVALFLIYQEVRSLDLIAISQYVKQVVALSVGLKFAAVLIALAVILKTAQLPLHGWLIQVMEAPTPVSALLHAGVVNLGGFVLIRLADLISAVIFAQVLLVVVGSLTAVLAALVMMTRISIKVRLAWSTCAQMGFMLMQCGLGLYDLALLHLVAHSLYKAYAFLSAGDTVAQVRTHDLMPAAGQRSAAWLLTRGVLVVPVAIGLVWVSVLLWKQFLPGLSVSLTAMAVIGLGLAPLVWVDWVDSAAWLRAWARGLLRVLVLVQLYIVWHLGASTVLPNASHALGPLAAFVIACFAALYLVQVWLIAVPQGAFAARVYPWAYGGFYLDERFTRFTFRVWPAPTDSAKKLSSQSLAAER